MERKSRKNGENRELDPAEDRVQAIKIELAEAMKQRAALPKSASDEEKAAAAGHVEGLQTQLHEAKQQVLSIKRGETAKLERDHKEKKQRHKRLKAMRQGDGHVAPYEEPSAPSHRPAASRRSDASRGPTATRPADRAAEEASRDAANAHDAYLERQRLEAEDKTSSEEMAVLRRAADKKRKKDEAAKRREAKKREKAEAKAKDETERLSAEKKDRAGIRQQAALQRSQEAKAKKRQQRADREGRDRGTPAAGQTGWFSAVLRMLKGLFGGRR
ncbi:MAG: hypothetical protein IH987_08375 [Planctomycetes bacterium]|nr:hypothetical protein [Planctomycetota bacterium]